MINGLGGWQFGPSFGFWSNQDLNENKRIINFALKNGITHFDTAVGYNNGGSEQLIGQQIRLLNREKLTLATKIMPTTSKQVEKLIDKSLNRLFSDYLDILYIHWPKGGFNYKPLLKQLIILKNKGKIKHLGLSNFNLSDLEFMSNIAPIDYYQRPISLFWSKDLNKAQKLCNKKNIKLVGYSPLGLGTLSGKYNNPTTLNDSRKDLFVYKENYYPIYLQLMKSLNLIAASHNTNCSQIALAWARYQNPEVLLLGASSRQQLRENLNKINLTENEINSLTSWSYKLMEIVPTKVDNYFFHDYD